MDIRKYAVNETSTVNLVDAEDQPLIGEDGKPMTWTVYGPGTAQYAKAQQANQNRLLDAYKRKGKSSQTAEEKVREAATFVADCTVECSGNIEYEGLKGRELHMAILSDLQIGFIAEQLVKHLGAWANFSEGLYQELSPYIRALAWWHAIPNLPPSGLDPAPNFKRSRESRMAVALGAGKEPDLPDLDPALSWFVQALFDAGPATVAGSGTIALTWADLQAWQQGTGYALPPWQLHILRRLSADYVTESHAAVEHDAPEPWLPALTPERRAQLDKHLRDLFKKN